MTSSNLQKSANATLSNEIYRYLWLQIATLNFLPGKKLSEAGLARQFQCSRIPVREAVQRLVTEDALTVLPQRGSFVTPINLTVLEQIRYMREVLETRVVLDGFDAGLLDSVLPLLESLLERQRKQIEYKNYEAIFELDEEFHRIFYTISHREFVLQHTGKDEIHYYRARLLTFKMEAKTNMLQQHEEILEAIRCKDRPRLEEALVQHFHNVNIVLQDKCFQTREMRKYFSLETLQDH